jgi:SMC interacting uncharacterized protein involved in chromosome segregation
MDVIGSGRRVFPDEKPEVSVEQVRLFVRQLSETTEVIKTKREALKEAIESHEEVCQIDEDIKALKEKRKEVITTSPVLGAYELELKEATEDRRQLIADAKSDGIPKKEIDTAIKMLKADIDPLITTEVFSNIADLVD